MLILHRHIVFCIKTTVLTITFRQLKYSVVKTLKKAIRYSAFKTNILPNCYINLKKREIWLICDVVRTMPLYTTNPYFIATLNRPIAIRAAYVRMPILGVMCQNREQTCRKESWRLIRAHSEARSVMCKKWWLIYPNCVP